MTLKEQNFGIEIELTGITREKAARVIADYFGTGTTYIGTYYQTYGATDRKGRTWKAMSDSSIRTQRKEGNHTISASGAYSCEVVSPILQYDDLDDLQNIVRALRAAGAMANDSCGIHVHVDGANHTAESLTRLVNFAVGRQDLFYEALEIGDRADHWCKKINGKLLKAMKRAEKTAPRMEAIWYSPINDGYRHGISHEHYNPTRYHGINLHAFFTKGTVEFRLFNGTTHAGKIKAYIQFCLGMSAWAINCPNDNLFFRKIDKYSAAQKAAIMNRVLIRRLGLKGPEFKTARYHLTRVFTEQAAAADVA